MSPASDTTQHEEHPKQAEWNMSDHDTTPENTYPEILTSEQAMSFLQIGRTAFYKALRAGEIPCRRFSQRMIRFHRETLSAWIAGGAIPAAAEQAPPPLSIFEEGQTPATLASVSGNDNGRVPGTTMTSDQREEAKRAYLADVEGGAPLKVAARDAGVTMGAVRNWRDSDKAFDEAEQAIRN
jgi:predicted DNA-binding transcriptional regulator AlpA